MSNETIVDKLHRCIAERNRLTRLYFEARTNRMRSNVLALSLQNNERIRIYEETLAQVGMAGLMNNETEQHT